MKANATRLINVLERLKGTEDHDRLLMSAEVLRQGVWKSKEFTTPFRAVDYTVQSMDGGLFLYGDEYGIMSRYKLSVVHMKLLDFIDEE